MRMWQQNAIKLNLRHGRRLNHKTHNSIGVEWPSARITLDLASFATKYAQTYAKAQMNEVTTKKYIYKPNNISNKYISHVVQAFACLIFQLSTMCTLYIYLSHKRSTTNLIINLNMKRITDFPFKVLWLILVDWQLLKSVKASCSFECYTIFSAELWRHAHIRSIPTQIHIVNFFNISCNQQKLIKNHIENGG